MGDRIAHPCAFTIRVWQTSENWAPGSRLVTSIDTLAGTLELRRAVWTFVVLCIALTFSTRNKNRPAVNRPSAVYNYVNAKLVREG